MSLESAASITAGQALSVGGTTKRTQGFTLRCAQCLERSASNVCVVCGGYLCEFCTRRTLPGFRESPVARLPKGMARQGSSYCRNHVPKALSPTGIASFGLAASGALAFTAGLPAAGMFGMFCSPVLYGLRTRLDPVVLRNSRAAKAASHGVAPHYDIEIEEDVQADFLLGVDDKPYLDLASISGRAAVQLKLIEDSTSGRGRRGAKSEPCSQVHAGFVAFLANPGISSEAESFPLGERYSAVPLAGATPAGFDAARRQQTIGKTWHYRYTPVPADPERELAWRVPLHVFPFAAKATRNSHVWGLEFRAPETVSKVLVTEFRIDVPAELEGVVYTDGLFERDKAQVVWRDLAVTHEEPATILVEFTHPIHDAKLVTGRYSAEVPGHTLSGLRVGPGGVWYPTGRPAERNRISEKRVTKLRGSVVAATSLQPKYQEVIARRRTALGDTALTVALAHEIIRRLAQSDLYAKDIAAAHEEGVSGTRYWEVIGRRYLRNQPCDVHIVLAAEGGASAQAQSAGLTVEVVVRTISQAQFAAQERQEVEALADDLVSCVHQALASEVNDAAV